MPPKWSMWLWVRMTAEIGSSPRWRRASASAALAVSARGQGVDQDPAGLPLDQRHVGEVVAAHLMDAGRHLEETVDSVELRLAPQARVDARGRFARYERVVLRVPRGATGLPRDDDVGIAGDESSPGILEVLLVTEGELARIAAFASAVRGVGAVWPRASASGAQVLGRLGRRVRRPASPCSTARARQRRMDFMRGLLGVDCDRRHSRIRRDRRFSGRRELRSPPAHCARGYCRPCLVNFVRLRLTARAATAALAL